MSDELKPCSMCGWPAEQMWDPEEQIIRCTNKDSFCHNALYGVYYNEWQNRPIEDALRAERDALKSDNERLQVQLAGCSVAVVESKDIAKQGDYGWSQSYQDVLNLRSERDALAAEVERLREANRWIPVKDINLKNATRVDVFMVNEWQEKATYFTHGWKGEKLEHHPCWKNDIGEILSGVTHYRPLPPPPQENEVEE